MSRDKTIDKKHRVLRKLGNLEKYQVAIHNCNLYLGTSVLCRYVVPRSVITDAEAHGADPKAVVAQLLETAIVKIVQEQPLLRVGLAGEDSSEPAWIALDSVDLTRHIKWDYPEESLSDSDAKQRRHETARTQLDTKFTDLETRPGWRVFATWLGSAGGSSSGEQGEPGCQRIDVLLVWNHPNFDGMGAKIFHRSLLRHLNSKPSSAAPPSAILKEGILHVSTTRDRFPPPQDNVIVFPLSAGYALKEGWTKLSPTAFKSRATTSTYAYWAPHVASPLRTQLRVVAVPDRVLRGVLRRCRERGATLTALLHALMLVSMARRLPEDGRSKGFESVTAVDTRRFASAPAPDPAPPAAGGGQVAKWRKACPWFEPAESMACYVMALNHRFGEETVAEVREAWCASLSSPEAECKGTAAEATKLPEALQELVWAAAGRAKGDIDRRLDAGPKDNIMGLMRFIGDWRGMVMSRTKKPREESWLITNLGVVDGSGGGGAGAGAGAGDKGWRIDDAEFHVCADAQSAALELSVISVKGEGLSISFAWQDAAIEAAFAERVVADVERWLTMLGQD